MGRKKVKRGKNTLKPLTISFKYEETVIDIIVKEDQRIADVIQVLQDNHVLLFFKPMAPLFLRSWRLETLVNPCYTFKQATIENGDILQFMVP